MKNILASWTIVGFVISLLAKFAGVDITSHETSIGLDALKELWPLLIGLGADLTGIWHRIRATKFNLHALESPVFWSQLVSGIMMIAAAFGTDLSGLQVILDKSLTAGGAVMGLVGIGISIIGRMKANQRIDVGTGRSYGILFMLLPFFALASCASTPVETANVCPTANATLRKGSCVALKAHRPLGVLFAWAEGTKLWPAAEDGKPAIVDVAFLDGTASQQNKAWARFEVIDGLAPGLQFNRVTTPATADIRVSFSCSGHWSYIGTDARSRPKTQATMNLELRPADTAAEWDRVALHEALHAIAFGHEHQHPLAFIPWNEAAVIDYYTTTQGWTEQEVRYQVLDRDDAKELRSSGFDPKSIMMYPIPSELTDGKMVVGWNGTLTPQDKMLIASVYPQP